MPRKRARRRTRDYGVTFTLESRNSKVGPIPVSTTTDKTCPDDCPLKASGCYAKHSRLGMLWRALSATTAGRTFNTGRGMVQTYTWRAFCGLVAALPAGTFWRHNQAGDLPGHGNAIDRKALRALVKANRGRHGWTYTHKPPTAANLAAIGHANANGFTINLSADTLPEADALAATGNPTVVVLPDTVAGRAEVFTPAGRRVVVCPATYLDAVNCASCKLCARVDRSTIVGFPAHGASHKRASAIARDAS
jgi:hypothetical protein